MKRNNNRVKWFLIASVLILALLLIASGCGSSTSDNGPVGMPPQGIPNIEQPEQNSQPIDPCSVLTKDEIASAIGPVKDPVNKGTGSISSGGRTGCEIDSTATVSSGVSLSRYEITITTWAVLPHYEYQSQFKTETGIGDQAFWVKSKIFCKFLSSPRISVYGDQFTGMNDTLRLSII